MRRSRIRQASFGLRAPVSGGRAKPTARGATLSPDLAPVAWESTQDFVERALAAYPTVHPVVEQFRAVGVSRPLELLDANDRMFSLAVIEAWSAQVEEDQLPPGITELRDALRADAS